MLIIALNLLYDYFERTIAFFLHLDNKDLEKIQQIIISIKEAKMAKQAINQTANLGIMRKKRLDGWQ